MTLLDAILVIFLALALIIDLSNWPPLGGTRVALALTIVVVLVYMLVSAR